jgi:hypothetical protein
MTDDKNQYQALLRSKVKSAVEQARAAAVFTHQGVKGSVLEILIGGLFEPLLPSDIGVGTGQIIDCYGSPMSGQVDIILYDKSVLPPILVDGRLGVFPIESILYTIEVKTTLSAAELSSSHELAKKIERFGYLPGLVDDCGNSKGHPVEKARSVVFALNSDLVGNNLNEAQRYKKIYKEDSAHIRAICVAGREYWYDDGNKWIGLVGRDGFDEVLAFIGGITNTYKSVGRSRHSPFLGNYVVPDFSDCSLVESRRAVKVRFKCEGCGREEEIKPNVGVMGFTLIGALYSNSPCSACGGDMKSEKGEYKFINGELVIL